VVLRYWEDRSIDQVAALLGCSAGNVTSQSARRGSPVRAGRAAGPESERDLHGHELLRHRRCAGTRLGGSRRVRMAALAAAAQDLRWGWTMNSGFVAHAQQLRLGGDSGQAWH
jgi:hypothetical protein